MVTPITQRHVGVIPTANMELWERIVGRLSAFLYMLKPYVGPVSPDFSNREDRGTVSLRDRVPLNVLLDSYGGVRWTPLLRQHEG